jgi:hypothetical protein
MFNQLVISANFYKKTLELLGSAPRDAEESDSMLQHEFNPLVGVVTLED